MGIVDGSIRAALERDERWQRLNGKKKLPSFSSNIGVSPVQNILGNLQAERIGLENEPIEGDGAKLTNFAAGMQNNTRIAAATGDFETGASSMLNAGFQNLFSTPEDEILQRQELIKQNESKINEVQNVVNSSPPIPGLKNPIPINGQAPSPFNDEWKEDEKLPISTTPKDFLL